MKSFAKTAAVVTALIITLTGCSAAVHTSSYVTPSETSTSVVTPSEAPNDVQSTQTPGTVTAALETLPVVAETNSDTYSRDEFKHWVSKNPTGCDTRFAVLEEESVVPVQTSGCSITSGKWVSSYDGVEVTNAGDLDIDHMVPLAEAWRSGAYNWDASTREAYANDLGYEDSLIAVTASSNRSKSDQDPANWLPDTDACVYVTHWVMVKYRWSLTVDSAEKDKILQVLSFCDDEEVVYPEKASIQLSETPVATVTPETAPSTDTRAEEGTDPKFGSCKEANKNGYGPYTQGVDEEYDWYRDGDNDGVVCE